VQILIAATATTEFAHLTPCVYQFNAFPPSTAAPREREEVRALVEYELLLFVALEGFYVCARAEIFNQNYYQHQEVQF
jgi:hypothetical protein